VANPFFREGGLQASFSKDILSLGGTLAVFCHLSISHQPDRKEDADALLVQFKQELGEPSLAFDTHPPWLSVPNHHSLWRTDEKVP
jgi:hypothetical protein